MLDVIVSISNHCLSSYFPTLIFRIWAFVGFFLSDSLFCSLPVHSSRRNRIFFIYTNPDEVVCNGKQQITFIKYSATENLKFTAQVHLFE